MEGFKGVLKRRLNLMLIFNGLAVVFIVLTGLYGNMAVGNEDFADMIHGFQTGIFVGLQLMMLVYIAKYQKALKNEEKLKQLYIEEHDERTKLIKDKIGGIGFNFSMGAIGTATVMSGFFSRQVFATLLGVLIFMVLVKGSLKLYYKNKY